MKTLFFVISLFFLFSLLSSQSFAGLGTGDTEGYVQDVKMLHSTDGNVAFQVWFETSTLLNDRWGCIASQGYVTITSASPYVTDQMAGLYYATAYAAGLHGLILIVEGPPNCNQQNTTATRFSVNN